MQSKQPSLEARRVPPQLIGIIDDARRANIDTFTLEYSRGFVMASFSAKNHATEIDFEFEAGEEMLRYLRAGAPDPRVKQWTMRCTYGAETFDLLVQQTGQRSKSPLKIKWAMATDASGVQ